MDQVLSHQHSASLPELEEEGGSTRTVRRRDGEPGQAGVIAKHCNGAI